MMQVSVTFPCKTRSEANLRGLHWARTRRIRSQRLQAGHHLRVHAKDIARLVYPITVSLTRAAPSSGLDDDNLRAALKAIRDGVADALGIDDRDPRVCWEYDQRRGPYSVEVQIRRRESR